MTDCELTYIRFGIASREDILLQSVVEITSSDRFGDGSVYDERMGPLDYTKCKTCMQPALSCTGHFGHINLIEPIVNPMFSSRLLTYFGIFCWYCSSRVISTIPKIQRKRNESFISILNAKTRGLPCHQCGMYQPVFAIDKYGILVCTTVDKQDCRVNTFDAIKMLSNIKSDDLKLIVENYEYAHPKNYILSALPVLPHINRPFLYQGNQTCDDDLTTLYLDIVKNNIKAKKYPRDSEQYLNHLNKVAFTIQILFNNSNGTAKHPSSGRKIRGLAERMAGKEGLFRNNCNGKRSDHTARAVASPGPGLRVGEIGLPRSIANILTRVIKCTLWNREELQELCDNNMIDRVERLINGSLAEFGVARFCNQPQTRLDPGDVIMRDNCLPIIVQTGHEILQEGDKIIRGNEVINAQPKRFRQFTIEIGDLVSRYLQNGDVLLVNRQPTLHTGSMVAGNIIIHDDFTIKLQLSVTKPFNLDFDGDEVSFFFLN